MLRATKKRRGTTIIELMVVMTMMGVASTILMALYLQSRSYLSRGSILTELEQRARIAGGRIIPKIASACKRPAVDLNADGDTIDANEQAMAIKFPPPPPYGTPLPANLNPPREVVLYSTKSYVRDLLREPAGAGNEFNPRNETLSAEMREYRIFFVPRNVDINKYPDGIVGDVFIDGNTPGVATDDVPLVSNLRDVRFDREENNVIRLTLSVKAYDPFGSGAGGRTVLKRQHVTKVYLPIFTHTPGG